MLGIDNKLQEAIDERETVLMEIERALFTRRYNLSRKHQDIFSIQSISMAYAIWEGFVQTAFNLYIDELNKIDIEVYEFCDEIIIHHMENSFRQFKAYPTKDNQKIKFLRELKIFHEKKKSPIVRIVNTQSNVGFDVLNKLLKNFSLEQFPEYWGKYIHPNPNLKDTMKEFLRLRNIIAHGGSLLSEATIDQNSYNRYRQLVRDLMYEIRIKMLDGLSKETFMPKNSKLSA